MGLTPPSARVFRAQRVPPYAVHARGTGCAAQGRVRPVWRRVADLHRDALRAARGEGDRRRPGEPVRVRAPARLRAASPPDADDRTPQRCAIGRAPARARAGQRIAAGCLTGLAPGAVGSKPTVARSNGRLEEALTTLPAAVAANLSMVAAAADDVAGALSGREPLDPFDFRDPEYIQRTLPALRLWSRLYFRADVRGFDNIPADGPVLLVGNHSAGRVIRATFFSSNCFYDHLGLGSAFHHLVQNHVFNPPGPLA